MIGCDVLSFGGGMQNKIERNCSYDQSPSNMQRKSFTPANENEDIKESIVEMVKQWLNLYRASADMNITLLNSK